MPISTDQLTRSHPHVGTVAGSFIPKRSASALCAGLDWKPLRHVETFFGPPAVMAAKLEVQATLAAMPPGGRKRAQRKAVHEFLEEARASATVLEFLDSEWCSSQVKEVASQLAERVATGVSPPEAAAYRYSDPKHIIATLRTEIHFAGVYQPAVPLRDIAGLVLRRAARQRVCFHKGAASHSFRDATRPIIGFAEYSKEHLALRHEAYP